MKKIFTRQFVDNGGLIPKGYAVSYFKPESAQFVAYPVGIHWIVKVARRFYFDWLLLYTPNAYDARIENAFRDGFNRGREAGQREGAEMIITQMRNAQAQMMAVKGGLK